MKKLEKILKVFANARRLSIMEYLQRCKEAPVGRIAGEIKLSFKATSRHLNILFASNMVERDQRDIEVYYRLSRQSSKMLKTITSIL